jgi:hypothetical protein
MINIMKTFMLDGFRRKTALAGKTAAPCKTAKLAVLLSYLENRSNQFPMSVERLSEPYALFGWSMGDDGMISTS